MLCIFRMAEGSPLIFVIFVHGGRFKDATPALLGQAVNSVFISFMSSETYQEYIEYVKRKHQDISTSSQFHGLRHARYTQIYK